MRILIIALATIMLTGGCSDRFMAKMHMRKAQKHLLKAQSYGAEWARDTIMVERRVPVPGVQADTLVSFDPTFGVAENAPPQSFANEPGGVDSVILDKGRLKVKTVIRWRDRLVKVEGECLPDTVKVEVPISVNNTLDCPPCKYSIWDLVVGLLIALVIGFAVGRFLRLRKAQGQAAV